MRKHLRGGALPAGGSFTLDSVSNVLTTLSGVELRSADEASPRLAAHDFDRPTSTAGVVGLGTWCCRWRPPGCGRVHLHRLRCLGRRGRAGGGGARARRRRPTLRSALDAGWKSPASRWLKDADALLLCVPSLSRRNRQPKCSTCGRGDGRRVVTPGTLVALELTTPFGTTEDVVLSAATSTG